jgi:hypothetical protein
MHARTILIATILYMSKCHYDDDLLYYLDFEDYDLVLKGRVLSSAPIWDDYQSH